MCEVVQEQEHQKKLAGRARQKTAWAPPSKCIAPSATPQQGQQPLFTRPAQRQQCTNNRSSSKGSFHPSRQPAACGGTCLPRLHPASSLKVGHCRQVVLPPHVVCTKPGDAVQVSSVRGKGLAVAGKGLSLVAHPTHIRNTQ